MPQENYDVIVVGAGAAGLMTAIQAAKRGRSTLIVEHTQKIGEKIRISGGGRCNFTNLGASSENYISQNPHFMKSALANYTQHDFINLVQSYKIAYHEKTLGQLFCDGSSKQIIAMLLDQCQQYGVKIKLGCSIWDVSKEERFHLLSSHGELHSNSLVVATGGLSIPQMGATDFGYRIAKQFGLKIVETMPALVPLWVEESQRSWCSQLSGVAVSTVVSREVLKGEGKGKPGRREFRENILFTHKGVSGPAILQISSYLPSLVDQVITINLLDSFNLTEYFKENKHQKQTPAQLLKTHLPNRLVEALATPEFYTPITDLPLSKLRNLGEKIHEFQLRIMGSEGYQKAEVTVGGVDTKDLSSKTMASLRIPQLFFVGEVVDVTGWLGGYNFQWAWSSGYAAGQYC